MIDIRSPLLPINSFIWIIVPEKPADSLESQSLTIIKVGIYLEPQFGGKVVETVASVAMDSYLEIEITKLCTIGVTLCKPQSIFLRKVYLRDGLPDPASLPELVLLFKFGVAFFHSTIGAPSNLWCESFLEDAVEKYERSEWQDKEKADDGPHAAQYYQAPYAPDGPDNDMGGCCIHCKYHA
jgi:hypothetical protein